MKSILTAILLFISFVTTAQTGLLMQRYYISGSLSVGQSSRQFADSSAWLQLGNDTTSRGLMFPKVLLDSIQTTTRALYVYDLQDSVLYHFDGNKRVRYMTYRDTVLLKELITANPPDLSAYYKNGGNAYGATAVIGTNDNKGINFIVDDTVAVSLDNKRVWTRHGRTDINNNIPLSIGTGYELYGLNHASSGYLTYISGYNGDFASGYGLVFGKPTNKVVQITDNQVQLNQNVVVGAGKTLQAGNLYTFESSPYTGLKYSSNNSWQFAIRDWGNTNRFVITTTGNVLLNTNTDDGYRLSVNGTTRITDHTYIEKNLVFQNNTQGIQILDGNTTGAYTSVLIGRNNGSTGGRGIKIGNNNSSNATKIWQYAIGEGNNLSQAPGDAIAVGSYNSIITEDTDQFIVGYGNTINFVGGSTSRGQFIVGVNNSVLHRYSSILGNNQQTTADNQLIIADGNANTTNGGYRQVFFGSGPRSSLSGGLGAPVTINASGGNGTDKTGGYLKLAAGKSTGSATPQDVIFATATASASGAGLQTLTDRWFVKGGTGYLSNNTSPTALLDVAGAAGYNQLRLRTSYTPSSTADANGHTGDIAWDGNYLYIKTAAGWKRTTLSDF